MNRDMNAFRQPPTTPLGRVLHDLARHDVPDDRDLRDRVMHAIQQRGADRVGSNTGESAWNLPALDPARQRRRMSTPDTSDEHSLTDSPTAQPDELAPSQQRRWFREALKLVAAAIVFITIGAVLALTLRNDDDQTPAVQPSGPTPTAVSTATSIATETPMPTATDAAVPTLVSTPPLALLPTAGSVLVTADVDQTVWRSIAVGAGSIWITNSTIGLVDRIDPATGEVIAQIRAGLPDNSQMTGLPNVWGITYGHDAVWVTASREQAILRIDPATNEIADTIYVDGHVASIVATDDAIWAGAYDEPVVLRIDPNSRETVATIAVPAAVRTMLAMGDALWVQTRDDRLSRIDTATNSIQWSVPGGANACSCGVPLAGDDSGLWTVAFNGAVYHLDPTSGSSIALLDPISGDPVEVAIVGEEVWVVLADDGGTGHLERVDPATNTVVARGPTFDLTPESGSGLYVDVAVDGDTLWIVNSLDTVVAIDPTP